MADAGGIRAGRAYIELGVNDRIAAGLARAKARLLTFGRSLRAFGGDLTAVSGRAFAGAAAVTGGLAVAVRSYVSQGAKLVDMSERTGMSVEALSELGYAAEQTGTSLEAIETGVKRMQRSLYDARAGSKTAVDALSALGLKAEDLQGQLPDAQFEAVTSALARIKDPSQKAALSLVLFGRAGTQLLPMLDSASGGLEALRQRAREMGFTISGPGAKAAKALGDAFTDVGRTLKAVAFAVGRSLAPTLMRATAAITDFGASVSKWVRANQAIIITAGLASVAVGGLAAAVLALGSAMTLAAPVFRLLAGGVGIVASVFSVLMSPIGLVIAAVGAAGYAFARFTSTGKASIKWLGDSFGWLSRVAADHFAFIARIAGKAWGGIADAFAAGELGLAIEIAMRGARLAWLIGIDKLKAAWDSLGRFVATSAAEMWAAVKITWAKFIDWAWSSFPKLSEATATLWANVVAQIKLMFVSLSRTVQQVMDEIDRRRGKAVNRTLSVGEVKHRAKQMREVAGQNIGRARMLDIALAVGGQGAIPRRDRLDAASKKYVEEITAIDAWEREMLRKARLAGATENAEATIEAERKASIAAAKQRTVLTNAGQSPLADELAKIEADLDESIRDIDNKTKRAALAPLKYPMLMTDETRANIEEADDKLRQAIAQAKLFRESAEGWAAGSAPPPTPPTPAPEAIEEAASKMSVQGTFLASSVGGLAGAGTLTKIAAATERTARATEATAAGIQTANENEA